MSDNQETAGEGATLAAVLEKQKEQIPHEILEREDQPGSLKRFKVRVPAETFQVKTDEALGEIKGQVTIPGFRRGKAPVHLVRNRFAKAAREEAVRKMVPRLAAIVAEEEGVDALTQPIYDSWAATDEGAADIEIRLEVRPTIEITEEALANIEVEATEEPVTDEKVAAELEAIRVRFADFVAPEDNPAIQETDALVFDRDVYTTQGQKIPSLSCRAEYSANLKGDFPEPVLARLVGSKKGEKLTVDNVTIGNPPNTAVVKYVIHIHEVKKRELPALDDEFAKDVSPDFATLDDLKKKVREEMEKNEAERKRGQILNGVFRTLSERVKFELPSTMVRNLTGRHIQSTDSRLRQMGLTFDRMDHNFRVQVYSNARAGAANEVRRFLLTDEIGKFLSIEADEEAVNAEIAKLAEAQGRKPLAIRAQLEARKELDQFKADLRLRKIHELLVERASVKVVEKLTEEVVAEAAEGDHEGLAQFDAENIGEGGTEE